MAKYRKKPIVIEAEQYIYNSAKHNNQKIIANFIGKPFDDAIFVVIDDRGSIIIPTLEGSHIASPGDWVIKGVKGEFCPCKPDIFEQTYDKVEE